MKKSARHTGRSPGINPSRVPSRASSSVHSLGSVVSAASTSPVEINAEFRRALKVMEKTRQHIFITGKAGTGKSTLLDYFRNSTRKKVAVVAPTGAEAHPA
ncbi:MAG: hypothetical protein FJY81_02030 [Candidatus Aminicenantes bacterium]|nr:hypothetical protein [Candidatus Aminicenantes bacterium]